MNHSQSRTGLPVLVVFLAGLVCAGAAPAPPLRHFMVNPITVTRKVQRDEPLPECFGTLSVRSWETVARLEPYEAGLRKTVRVSLARNEFESAQIVIKSVEGDLQNVRVRLGTLRRIGGGARAVFPAAGVTLLRVSYVKTYNLWNPKQSLGWWPDPLIPLEPGAGFSVVSGRNQPILIRFHAGPDTAAGEYRGKVTVTAAGFAA